LTLKPNWRFQPPTRPSSGSGVWAWPPSRSRTAPRSRRANRRCPTGISLGHRAINYKDLGR